MGKTIKSNSLMEKIACNNINNEHSFVMQLAKITSIVSLG